MYDIKIFLEENENFWARVNAWKEIVYWLWKNQEELMWDIQKWLEIAIENTNKNEKSDRLLSYITSNKNNLVCH